MKVTLLFGLFLLNVAVGKVDHPKLSLQERKYQRQWDPLLVRSILSNDFESGFMDPWQDGSPGRIHWMVENVDSPLESPPPPKPTSGSKHLRAVREPLATSGLTILYSPTVALHPGDQLTLSTWLYSPRTGESTLEVYMTENGVETLLVYLESSPSNLEWRSITIELPVDSPIEATFEIYGYCGRSLNDSIAIDNILLKSLQETTMATTPAAGTTPILPEIPECGSILISDEGSFKSPNFPNVYRPLLSCNWTIEVDPNKKIQLAVGNFETETNDYLTVYDGPDSTSSVLFKHSGNNLPPMVLSSSNVLFLEFISNELDERSGFYGKYVSVDETTTISPVDGCGGYIYGEGILKTPNHPSYYPNDLDCKWYLETVNPEETIHLGFSSFGVEDHDFMTVYDGWSDSGFMIKNLSRYSPPNIYSLSNKMLVRFTSDPYGVGSGFRWNVRMMNSPKCRVNLTYPNGTIYSPNYPDPYPGLLDCRWLITVQPGSRIKLEIETIYISISIDLFQVYDGPDTMYPLLYERSTAAIGIESTSNTMLIRFATSIYGGGSTGDGFIAHYYSI